MEDVRESVPIAARACILIINWNGKDNLRSCLKSCFLQDYPAFDVIVLDNASTDGSVGMVRTEFPKTQVIENGTNLGFTGAGNVGMKHAADRGYRFVLFLANDIILDARCLSQSIEYAEQNPTAGMIGFRVFGALSYVPLEDFTTASAQWNSLEAEETDWIEGAAYLMEPKLFTALGGYDEVLFMYGDENDLENRIRRSGYQLCRINVPVWHNAGRNVMGNRSIRAAYYTLRNTLIIFLKENPWYKALRMYVNPIRTACGPFVKIDNDQIVLKRYRPSNIAVNFFVLLAALFSVLWNLPSIFKHKHLHAEKIEIVRKGTIKLRGRAFLR